MALLSLVAFAVSCGGSSEPSTPITTGSGSGGAPSAVSGSGGASAPSAGTGGGQQLPPPGAGSGGAASGGVTGSGGASTTGGAPGAGAGPGLGSGGATSTAGAGGRGGTAPGAGTGGARAGTGGGAAGGSAVVVPPPGCTLPAVVSYQKDVQPFLITSCGGGNGCHVIDAVSTMAAGGFNHGYDWVTAGAHTSSCPTGPKRFEVVIAVINQANPASCSKSRIMPPAGSGKAALTACQVATLQAWLNEPLVTQMHRADDSSPTTPYPMPPFN